MRLRETGGGGGNTPVRIHDLDVQLNLGAVRVYK